MDTTQATTAHRPSERATVAPTTRPHLRRSRWAALGAAVAVSLGAGGLGLAGATGGEPSGVVTITPERILDTRTGVGLDGPFTSPSPRVLQVTGQVPTPTGPSTVVPDGATGVVLNVTAVQPTADGFISVRPDGAPGAPETSNLNFSTGDIIPNSVTVALSPTGAIELTYDAFGTPGPTTDVLVDVTGFLVENDVYSTAEADARFARADDLAAKSDPLEVHSSQTGHTQSLDPQATVNGTTVTTSTAGKLQVTMRGEMSLPCDVGFSFYYLVVNDEPIESSAVEPSAVFEGILFGTTDDVVPAGEHTIAMGAQCFAPSAFPGPPTSGDYTNTQVLVVP